ncbi:antitoxin [Mycolicibacterium sediminis]|uniref:Putative antitoxin VapB9 n=1 Tax=Mycolicibacterium sediminis TaxID=1286180 RepID=A0A7I7QPC3_9MYCO|nr:antitoxin [Mycolicibacterium sediminis]BBY28164.1 putative antitoxin VapB9 [Mycolicibacterium sediminis]
MRNLYLRNVPDAVMDRLERMSRAEGMSLNAMAIRVDNAALMATLPDTGIASEDIVADVDAGRRWSP